MAGSTFEIASILKEAGGELVGRTRFQKLLYMLFVSGLGPKFTFEYRHYGPYSDDALAAIKSARYAGLISEEEQVSNWGGAYSVYTLLDENAAEVPERAEFVRLARDADAVELELAATALYLAKGGEGDPWAETAHRKPDKADEGTLRNAQILYERLRSVHGFTERLPQL